jgi:hypothetical protein
MSELEQKGNLCLISFTQNEQHLRFAFAAFFSILLLFNSCRLPSYSFCTFVVKHEFENKPIKRSQMEGLTDVDKMVVVEEFQLNKSFF